MHTRGDTALGEEEVATTHASPWYVARGWVRSLCGLIFVVLLAVETALEALSYAGRQSLSRYELIVQFKKMTDSLHRWYLPQEQQIGLRVYQPILGELMNMPRRQDGSADPLAAYIAEETAMLRRQRVTLSESQPSLIDAASLGR